MSLRMRAYGIAAAAFLIGAQQVAGADTITINPTYHEYFADAVTGDNAFSVGGDQYWYIDPGADSYQNEFYERPTIQRYDPMTLPNGEEGYVTTEYFENLDITQGAYGYDENYMYFAIQLFGLEGGGTGLRHEYGIRFSDDLDGRGGYLLRSDSPFDSSPVGSTSWTSLRNTAFWDSDDDVGGLGDGTEESPTGRSVTLEDNPEEYANNGLNLNGFDQQVIDDGYLHAGVQGRDDTMFSRINPDNEIVVEIALNYGMLGLDLSYVSTLEYLDFQAIKGDPADEQNYLWNDVYDAAGAGSPYLASPDLQPEFYDLGLSEFGTQGLGNIYELDTMMGISPPIPEPTTITLLGIGLAGLAARRRFGKHS